MHAIRNRQTKEIVFIDYSTSPAPLPGYLVYPAYDDATMEVGWTNKTYVPAHFDIDSSGIIVELTLDEAATAGRHALPVTQKLIDGRIVDKTEQELVDDGAVSLDELKRGVIDAFSAAAFEARRAILPDYKLQNALLGVYDEATVANYRATVQAFRDEFYRVKALADGAENVAQLRAVSPEFPATLVSVRPRDVTIEARRSTGSSHP